MTAITKLQLKILQHSVGADEYGRTRCERNHFVTDKDSADGGICRSLVALGLMRDCGSRGDLTGGGNLYLVTADGRSAIAEHSPKPPKISKARRRYLDYLDADSGLPFIAWLKQRKTASI